MIDQEVYLENLASMRRELAEISGRDVVEFEAAAGVYLKAHPEITMFGVLNAACYAMKHGRRFEDMQAALADGRWLAEAFTKTFEQHGLQVSTDGRTVWVNGPAGCRARFGPGGAFVDHHHFLPSECTWREFVGMVMMDAAINLIQHPEFRPEWTVPRMGRKA